MLYLKDLVKPEIYDKQVPDVQDQLSRTKIPRHAFVLMAVPKLANRRREGRFYAVPTMGIFLINVEDLPNQKYILDDALFNLNGRLLAYANFPTHDDKDSLRAQKWRLYSEPNGVNPWDNMASYCNSIIDNSIAQTLEVKKIQAENTKLAEEAEKLRAEVEELRKDKNAKPNKTEAKNG